MLSLRIALRYLFSRKTHNAVNVISLISLVGVGVAAMALVVVLSVFNGFSDLAAGRLSVLTPDLRVDPAAGKVIARADSLAALLTRLPGVEAAVPVVEEHALAMYAGRQMPVMMKGVPEAYRLVADLDSIIIDGAALTEVDAPELGPVATLSVGAALGLDARPGFVEKVALNVPRRVGRINPAMPARAFRSDSLLVAGVFQAEQAEFDTELLFVPLDVARRLLDYNAGEASAIELRVLPGTSRRDVERLLPPGLIVSDRMEQQREAFRMISVEKWVTFFLLGFILVIASFNIISTLSMLIIEKQESTATLIALGATRGFVRRIFVAEGWLVTAVGGVAGILAGIILCLAQQWGGFIKLGGNHEAMSITVYPVRVAFPDLLAVMALVAAVGLLAAYLPGRMRRLTPA